MKYFKFYNCKFPERSVNLTLATKQIPHGDPRQVTLTFTAPSVSANREEDYRTAWTFFDAQADHSASSVTTN